MDQCARCRGFAINLNDHGRDGGDPDLCDVCYWRNRADRFDQLVEMARAQGVLISVDRATGTIYINGSLRLGQEKTEC